MAFSRLFACNHCDFDATLVHAEEWTPGPNGEPQPYTGYGPIGGLMNRLWCPRCRAIRPFAFVVLNPPATHAVVAYAEAQRLGCTGAESGPCPQCREPLQSNPEGEMCPRCETGSLHLIGEWESE